MPSLTATPAAKPRMPGRRETEIQAEILRYLTLVPGVVAWRQNTGAMFGEHKGKKWAVRFGKKGVSDIIGWQSQQRVSVFTDATLDGLYGVTLATLVSPLARFLAIEVKNEKRIVTPEQRAFLDHVEKAGGIAIVARSLDDVRRAFPVG